MDEKSEKYIELLCEALQMFYKNDAKALFRPDDSAESKVVNEQAMAGCIYRYVWCLRHQSCYAELEPDVDTEYDRMKSKDGNTMFDLKVKYVQKKIYPCPNSESCCCSKECWETICNYDNDSDKKAAKDNAQNVNDATEGLDVSAKPFRPDLIIHERNSAPGRGNGMIVEFKKDREEDDKDYLFDVAKVKFCSCDKQHFGYKIGVVVNLKQTQCVVSIHKGDRELAPFCVDASGRIVRGTNSSKRHKSPKVPSQ
ncbi:MAG: hypothetical protein K5882_11155 [Bacteroidales bacterium]|nr:hypothetical protein [Bacteroidales bacterium]